MLKPWGLIKPEIVGGCQGAGEQDVRTDEVASRQETVWRVARWTFAEGLRALRSCVLRLGLNVGCERDKGGGAESISDWREPVNKLLEKEVCRVCVKEAEEAKERKKKNPLRVRIRSSWGSLSRQSE